MEHDIKGQDNVYGSNDVATLLKVKESTLRKYTLLLEQAGYKYYKNEHGQRGFFDRDVIALKKLIEIKKHPNMTLKQACDTVVTWVRENSVSDSAIDDITPAVRFEERYISEIGELKQLVNQQTDLLKDFSKRLDQQQQYFEERMKQEQKDRELMEALRESLRETKQQKLELATAQEEKGKGFFARLFGK
jgi:hypothetical protein